MDLWEAIKGRRSVRAFLDHSIKKCVVVSTESLNEKEVTVGCTCEKRN